MESRHYRSDERPEIGDIVEAFDGAYGTAIITSIKDGLAFLERPHMNVQRIGLIVTPAIQVERFNMSLDNLQSFKVFVTGPSGNRDNRCRH